MNININLVLILVLVSFMFFACSEEEIPVSTVTSFEPYTIGNVPESLTISEGDDPVVIDFTFPEEQIVEVTLTIGPSDASTAVEDVDYTLSDHSLTFNALSEGGSFTFTALSDFVTEGDEKAFITISSDNPSGFPSTKVIEVTIKDVVTTDLVMNFDWDGTFEYLGDTYPICGNVDLDVYVLDAAGSDLGIYGAATGACPEQLIFSNIDDGEYFLASNMWENGLAGLELNVDYPITVNVFKQDIFDESYVTEEFWTSEDLDQANDGNASFKEVGKVVVSGDTYTITRPDGTLVAQG